MAKIQAYTPTGPQLSSRLSVYRSRRSGASLLVKKLKPLSTVVVRVAVRDHQSVLTNVSDPLGMEL